MWLWRATGLLCLALPFARVVPLPSPINVTFGQVDAVVGLCPQPLPPSDWLGPLVAGRRCSRAWRGGCFAWASASFGCDACAATARPAYLDESAEALRAAVAPRAELRWTSHLAQPVAFGLRRPLVLLPRSLATLSIEARQAVLCHELLHVARHDWPWIVAEDLVRAVMWFHPGVWWLLDQLHVSREQVVDATGRPPHRRTQAVHASAALVRRGARRRRCPPPRFCTAVTCGLACNISHRSRT